MLSIYNDKYDFKSVVTLLSATGYHLEKEILSSPFKSRYVFPTQRFSRYIQKKYIEQQGATGVSTLSIETQTLHKLALSITRQIKPDSKIVDEEKRYFQFSKLITDLSKSKELGFFGVQQTSIHALNNISKTLANLRDSGLLSKAINVDKLADGQYKLRLTDIKTILSHYENDLEKNDSVSEDEFSVYGKATAALEQLDLKDSISSKEIVISGYSKFKKYELDFLKALLKNSSVGVRVDFNYDAANLRLFGSLHTIIEQLQNLGLNCTTTGGGADANSQIAQSYFNNRQPDSSFPDNTFNIIACKDKLDEVKLVSRLIRYYHVENRIPLDQMILLSNDSSEYSHLIRENFSLEGIPSNITDRYILAKSPVVNSLLSLVDGMALGMPRRNLISITKNKYITVENLETTSITDVSEALHLFRIFNVSKWLRNRDSKLKSNNDLQSGKGLDALAMNSYQEKFKPTLDVIEIFYASLKHKYQLTPSEFAEYLLGVLSKTKIVDNVLSVREYQNQQEGLHQYNLIRHELEKDAQAVNSLVELLDGFPKYYGSEANVDRPFGELLLTFRVLLTLRRYQIKELPNYGVDVTSIEQAREMDNKIVFVLGLAEGITPNINRSDEPALGELFNQNIREDYDNQKMLFYQLLTSNKSYENNSDDRFIFTYPTRVDDQGKSISHFLIELKNLFQTKKCINQFPLNIDDYKESEQNLPLDHDFTSVVYDRQTVKPKPNDQVLNAETRLSKEVAEYYKITATNRVHSVTQLESYLNCQLKYLFSNTLRLTGRYYQGLDSIFIQKNELGTFYHTIVESFHNKIIENNKDVKKATLFGREYSMLALNTDHIKNYRKVMDECIEEAYRFEYNLQFVDYEMNSKRGVLYAFIDSLISLQQDSGYSPLFVESKFSIENTRTIEGDETESYTQTLKLKGSIDRVDISDDNANYRVVDYKTSSKLPELHKLFKATNQDNNKSLQVPIYAYAADNLLPGDGVEENQTAINTNEMQYTRVGHRIEHGEPIIENVSSGKDRGLIEKSIDFKLETAHRVLLNISHSKYDVKGVAACSFCPHPELCKKVKMKF